MKTIINYEKINQIYTNCNEDCILVDDLDMGQLIIINVINESICFWQQFRIFSNDNFRLYGPGSGPSNFVKRIWHQLDSDFRGFLDRCDFAIVDANDKTGMNDPMWELHDNLEYALHSKKLYLSAVSFSDTDEIAVFYNYSSKSLNAVYPMILLKGLDIVSVELVH